MVAPMGNMAPTEGGRVACLVCVVVARNRETIGVAVGANEMDGEGWVKTIVAVLAPTRVGPV